MYVYESLVSEAESARDAFENRLIPIPVLRNLLLESDPSFPRPDAFLDVAYDLFPDLNCALSSIYLRHRFSAGEVVYGSFNKQGHAFLMINNTVVDITADQFGGPEIYVGKLEEPWDIHI